MIEEVIIKKMHHRSPRKTERAAAHKVAPHVVGRRLQAIQALYALGGEGIGEQIARAAGLSILSIRPRLTELLEMQLIEDAGTVRKNTFGNNETVWNITEEGKQYVD